MMVGLRNKSIAKTIDVTERDWNLGVEQIIYGYRRRQDPSRYSSFGILYVKLPRIVREGRDAHIPNVSFEVRNDELLALEGF